jgi:hypothetical protein
LTSYFVDDQEKVCCERSSHAPTPSRSRTT